MYEGRSSAMIIARKQSKLNYTNSSNHYQNTIKSINHGWYIVEICTNNHHCNKWGKASGWYRDCGLLRRIRWMNLFSVYRDINWKHEVIKWLVTRHGWTLALVEHDYAIRSESCNLWNISLKLPYHYIPLVSMMTHSVIVHFLPSMCVINNVQWSKMLRGKPFKYSFPHLM